MKYIFLNILLFLLYSTAFAQSEVSVSLNADKSKLEIGEPLDVTLSIDFPASYNTKKIVLPLITDSAKLGDDIEIWSVTPPLDTILENNNGDFIKHYQQNFTIATFKEGLVDVNPVFAIFDNDTIFSNALTLTVSTVDLGENATLKNIKPIIKDPFTTWEKIKLWITEHLLLIVLIILIPILLYMVYWWSKRKPEKVIVKETIPLNQRVLSKLNEIEEAKLWQNGNYKKYYSEITDVLRAYLSERYHISTFEKTSKEILNQLKLKPISRDQFVQLEKLMLLSDLVKFAKTKPTPFENESAIKIAKEFINETYESNKTTINE